MKTFRRLLSTLLSIVALVGVIPVMEVGAVSYGSIPKILRNNYVLDFMRELGYDIDTQIDKDHLYEYEFTAQG